MSMNAQGVNTEQGTPPDPGVTADPPAAPDVNASVPSPEGVQPPAPEKPHEQAVPYDRFAEVNQQNAELKAQLDAIQNQTQPAPPDTPQGEQSPWGFEPQQPQPQSDTAPLSWDQIEEKVSQDMYTKPVSTMTPIIKEILRNERMAEKQQEARVRGIPDFQNYEQAFYSVPEELVQQAQSDPTLVKFLLAKHKETLARQGQPQPESSTRQQTPQTQQPQSGTFLDSQQPSSAPQTPGNGQQDPMEVLREQYRKEGEQRAIDNMRKQQGVTSEGTASPQSAPAGEQNELDQYGADFMQNLGIPADQYGEVAGRLNKFVTGDK